MHDAIPRSSSGEMVDLRAIWRAIASGKLIIAASVAVAVGVAVLVVLLSTPLYRAEIVMLPADSPTDQAGASPLGGLSQLIGGGGGGPKVVEAIELLESRALTDLFVERAGLLPVLYPALWDQASQRWRPVGPPSGLRAVYTGVRDWVRAAAGVEPIVERPLPAQPDGWLAYEKFSAIRKVARDTKTSVVTMTITWKDPVAAAEWANGLVALLNDYVRERDVREAERSLAYLTRQFEQASDATIRQTLLNLMEGQLKSIMLAQGKKDYLLRVLDPAQPPLRKAAPQTLVILAVGVVLGLLLGAVLAVVRAGSRRPRAPGLSVVAVEA